ncbi:ABC transporter substrate-binding protein [Janibacter limosus]|uniref:ABC transporter substrate-binding protein n=2 Tax=Janibacter limosus TaxID=53458 RepID=UPI0035DE14C5|nr:ABC transporter substrate-binding protein [Janibacter limosus]
MRRIARGLIAGSGALALVASASACTADDGGGSGSAATPSTGKVTGPEDRLTVLSTGPVQARDPQRITQRQVAGFASRTWMRTLTAYPPATALSGQRTLAGDLATSTGTASKDASTWTFTLRKGAAWQDGSPITCKDVRYGVARSFDPGISSSGYALTFLDIPKKKDGSSTYPGPPAKGGTTKSARQLINKAVECRDERTVVFHLDQPVGYFDRVVSLPEFAPFKASQEGKDATYEAFSSGPYRLSDGWTPSTGGTWVRNPRWKPASDPLRTPGPTSILHKEGVTAKDAVETIVDGEDGGRTLARDPLPTVLGPVVDEAGDRAQSVRVDGQLVDYPAVSTRSKAMKSARVRRALAQATDREAYNRARGADSGTPTWSLLGAALPAAHRDVADHGPSGDPTYARAQLVKGKVKTPVKITVAYRGGGTMDDAMKALKTGWDEAGFDVTLKALGEDYFTEVGTRKVAQDHDVVWANWGPDFPSASTVLPPLFDDRINLSKTSVGRDYGLFADKKVTAAMDKAAGTRDRRSSAAQWTAIDTGLLEDGVYIPLRQSRLSYAAGSRVTSLIGNPVYGGSPEIGVVGVSE